MKIYHYTSADALIGILSNAKLWATDIRFLNDYNELKIGLDLITQKNDNFWAKFELTKEHPFGFWSELFRKINASITNINTGYGVNVISFTTEPDYIRQWMAYCPSNGGYCIEFDLEKLKNSVVNDDVSTTFGEVYYHDDNKYEWVKGPIMQKVDGCYNRLLDVFLTEMNHSTPPEHRPKMPSEVAELVENYDKNHLHDYFKTASRDYFRESVFRAATVKPAEFSDEKEHRFVNITYKDDDLSHIKHRQRNGIIVPYLEVPFNISAISKIIIGPNVDQDLAEQGIYSLLASLSLENQIELTRSKCSLRAY
ncbi:DUF2971 domain-containing protein [Vibrio vulnificus]